MASEATTAEAIPGTEPPVPARATRRRKAAEAKPVPAKVLSEYVVMQHRIFETAEGETVEAWEDFSEAQAAHSGGDACRKVHNSREGLPEGLYHYRAFPVRSDIRVTATVEVKPVSLFANGPGR